VQGKWALEGYSAAGSRQVGGIDIRVLGFDSAAGTVGAALLESGNLLGQSTVARPRSASGLLAGLSQALLDNLDLNLTDVDGLAVVQGPGSFTGLRITTSFVAGLARSRDIPAIGVVSNAALVASTAASAETYLVGALDARASAVYSAAYYRPQADHRSDCFWHPVRIVSPRRRSICQTASMLRRHIPSHGRLIWVGDGVDPRGKQSFRQFMRCREGETIFVRRHIQPEAVAYIGWRWLCRGRITPPDQLYPMYYRKSSAERSKGEAT